MQQGEAGGANHRRQEEFRDWMGLVLLYIRQCVAELQEQGVLPLDPDHWHTDRIDVEEVEGLLAAFRHDPLLVDEPTTLAECQSTLGAWTARLEQRGPVTGDAARETPIRCLRDRCGLSFGETLLVVATLLDETFGHIDRLLRFIQDDFNLGPMTPYLAQRLLAPTSIEALERQSWFSPTGRLFTLGLLRWREPGRHPRENPLYWRFGLNQGVGAFLLGHAPGPPALAPLPVAAPEEEDGWTGLRSLLEDARGGTAGGRPRILQLVGRSSRGAEQLLAATLGEQGPRLWPRVAPQARPQPGPPERDLCDQLRLELLQARLWDAVPCWTGCGEPTEDPGFAEQLPGLLAELPDADRTWVILLGDTTFPVRALAAVELLQRPLPLPTKRQRAALWQGGIPADLEPEPALDFDLLASTYELGSSEIQEVLRQAVDRVRRRGSGCILRLADLREGCRQLLGQGLTRLATLVDCRHTLDDLVAAPKTQERIEEFIAHVRHRDQVLDRWKIGHKLRPRRGVSALFYGPPGTGKSLAASIIAGQLGLLLYRIDLSRVVDKYIGETEKHLEQIFRLADEGRAALLFDEADALFARRTTVQASVDRYSNMEVNYLLSRMESFDGVVVLTTNLPDQLDSAFRRRIDFKIEFPFPDQQERLRLWRALWPAEVPRSKKLPLAELAEDFEMAGGSIRNVIVRACFMAAEGRCPVDGALLRRAAVVEAEESGRLIARE